MEVGNRIREERERAGMSQEDLAAVIFVSRQTVSNWETGKTYPDVQSLLLLSNLFDAPIDSLVKGDVEAMDAEIRSYELDRYKVKAGVVACWILIVVGFAMLALLIAGDITMYSPLWFLAFGITWAALVPAFYAWNIERKHDIKTYREVKAFLAGEDPDAIPRQRTLPGWARNVAQAACGAAIGIVLMSGIMFAIRLLGL